LLLEAQQCTYGTVLNSEMIIVKVVRNRILLADSDQGQVKIDKLTLRARERERELNMSRF
jgi:hypothetical protein